MNKEEAFTKVLRVLRKKKGMTQEKLAEKSSINEKYFGQIERGKSIPSLTKFFNICDALKLKPSEVMNLIEELIVKY